MLTEKEKWGTLHLYNIHRVLWMLRCCACACMELSPHVLISLAQKGTLQATERETWATTQLWNPWPTICTACKMCWGWWWRTHGSDQTTFGLTWGPYHKKEPMPYTAQMTRNRKLDTRDLRYNQTWLAKIIIISEMIPLMIFCYNHRLTPCSVIVREASSGNRWEWGQRLTASHYAERASTKRASPSCPSPRISGNPTGEAAERL